MIRITRNQTMRIAADLQANVDVTVRATAAPRQMMTANDQSHGSSVSQGAESWTTTEDSGQQCERYGGQRGAGGRARQHLGRRVLAERDPGPTGQRG